MRIFLCGVSCVGKTTIGRHIAQMLGIEFCDFDKEMESFFQATISTLRDRYLTRYTFRCETSKALTHYLNRPESADSLIVMPADGLMSGYVQILKKCGGLRVVLDCAPEEIIERITFYDVDSNQIYKDLTDEEKKYYLKEIKKDRTYYRKIYDKQAHIRVDISGLDVQQSANRVIEAIDEFQASHQQSENDSQPN